MNKKSIFEQLKASANGSSIDKRKKLPKVDNDSKKKDEDITYKFAGYVLSDPVSGYSISTDNTGLRSPNTSK
uniref:Uncharacterized protein n=1 Tax=Parastrongyloides trichosuri TaxID=131310 RepID=A0A0N4Z6T9_PARTI